MSGNPRVRAAQLRLQVAGYYTGPLDWDWGDKSDRGLDAALAHAAAWREANPRPVVATTGASKILTLDDYRREAARLSAAARKPVTVPQIQAFAEVEGNGSGWFTDVRREILDLDGPGGFLDGPDLPKALFEAKWFHTFTDGRFDKSHPNLSSPRWNRALYVGGMGEWRRLWSAMELDREAALKSASAGAFQIMGFNHGKAGFATVEAFWEAMKEGGAAAHIAAFSSFVIADGLADEVAEISADPRTCRPAARGYNGAGYRANRYDEKIAAAFVKFSRV